MRESVGDYSWSELSAISKEIAEADSDEAALDIAARYHLVNDEGRLDGSQGKRIELANGAEAHALIASFKHDDAADGGKVGITFVFAEAVDSRAMNNNAGFDDRSKADGYDAEGGWNACEMRSWLNGEFADELPADLQAVMREVPKRSVAIPEFLIANVDDNDQAKFSDESLMGTGVDKLWLPCVSEVGDPSEDVTAVEDRPEWTSVLQGEGERYKLFEDAEQLGGLDAVRTRRLVDGKGDRACGWWLRSPEETTFAYVREDGSMNRSQDELAAHELGVVPCFAL